MAACQATAVSTWSHGRQVLKLGVSRRLASCSTPQQVQDIARGGYVLKDAGGKPDLILIATGSEVVFIPVVRYPGLDRHPGADVRRQHRLAPGLVLSVKHIGGTVNPPRRSSCSRSLALRSTISSPPPNRCLTGDPPGR
jgi:hypothetical protein